MYNLIFILKRVYGFNVLDLARNDCEFIIPLVIYMKYKNENLACCEMPCQNLKDDIIKYVNIHINFICCMAYRPESWDRALIYSMTETKKPHWPRVLKKIVAF